jgi:hypothetical protein
MEEFKLIFKMEIKNKKIQIYHHHLIVLQVHHPILICQMDLFLKVVLILIKICNLHQKYSSIKILKKIIKLKSKKIKYD